MKALKLLVLVACLPLFAEGTQRLRRSALPSEGRLPAVRIRRLMEDSRGYLWYATIGEGLWRDDGYRADAMSLPPGASGNVLCLEEDNEGRIWFGTETGLFYVDQGELLVHEPDTALRQSVSSIAAMRDGTLWAAVRGSLIHLSPEGRTLGSHPMLDRMGHPLIVPCMHEDSQGTLVGCASWNVGLFRYSQEGDSIEFLPWDGIEGSPQWMVEDTVNHCYWVATQGEGVVKYTEGKALRQGTDAVALHVSLDQEGVLWVCFSDRTMAYSTEGSKLTPLPYNIGQAESSLCDSRGNVWLTGLSPASFVLEPDYRSVRRIALADPRLPSAGHCVPERIAFAQDDVWFYVSRYGLCCLSSKGTLALPAETESWPPLGALFTPSSDGRGVWASRSKDLMFLSSGVGKVEARRVSYLGQDISSLLDDGRGSVWIGGTDCLKRFSLETGHPETVVSDVGSITALCADTLGGVYCITEGKGVMRVERSGRASVVLEGKDFTSLCSTRDGSLFVATAGTVLNCPAKDTLFATQGERILKVAADSLSHVWVLTAKRALELCPSTGASHTYRCSDQDIALGFFTDIQALGSGVAVAGSGAVCILASDPSLERAHRGQRVLLTSLTYNGERHLLASTPESLTLPHNAKDITLELTTLDYLRARQVVFSYRLSPRDQWHALPRGENAIHLSSLPVRGLRLEVKATVPGSVLPVEPLTLTLHRKPWHGWWWLLVVAVAVLASLTWLVLRHKRHKPQASAPTAKPEDEFLLRAQAFVEQHLSDEKYDAHSLASDLGMSRSALYRRLEAAGAPSPAVFIRNVRLRRAAELLREGRLSVSEVAFSVGFSYVSYFCRCFKEMYGVQPSQYK